MWVLLSPAVLSYEHLWNPLASGAVLVVLAAIRFGGAHTWSWLSGVNALVGGWFFASAFVLGENPGAAWNEVLSGMLIVAFAVWSMSASEEGKALERERRGGVRQPGHHPPTGA